MSTLTPNGLSLENERTILIPTAGRGRSSSSPLPSDTDAPPTVPDGSAFAWAATAAPTTAVANAIDPSLHLQGNGLNPLVGAANALLHLIVPLRYMPSHPDIEALREQLVVAIRQFEKDVRAHHIPTETIAAARYALCTFLDETVSSTPWGGSGVWSSRSLLVRFHNESWGGEKFFLILQRLAQDVRANIDVLELMYVCLAMGLEGRYRVLDGGRGQLDLLRERLGQLIRKERGRFEADLSPHWHGAGVRAKSLRFQVPLWMLASLAAAIILILYLLLSMRLHDAADPVHAAMRRIQVEAAPPKLPPAPVPVAARLARFLAPEVAEGLVIVRETAERSTVILRGDGVFRTGKADVEPAFLPLMTRIGDALEPVAGKVLVVGHTDNIKPSPASRYRSNNELSKARAASVVRLLAQRTGPPERYSVEGRGETQPMVANDSPAGRMRNRRVEIVVLTPEGVP